MNFDISVKGMNNHRGHLIKYSENLDNLLQLAYCKFDENKFELLKFVNIKFPNDKFELFNCDFSKLAKDKFTPDILAFASPTPIKSRFSTKLQLVQSTSLAG